MPFTTPAPDHPAPLDTGAPAAVYLDHAATTPMRPEAREAMLPFLSGAAYGNPSGAHRFARQARRAVDDSREIIAAALGAQPGEVVFTGSGTEADNLAIFGSRQAAAPTPAATPPVPVCTAIEHHAVLHPVEHMGGRVAPVDSRGIVDLDALAAMLDRLVTVVSVMLANNEVGVIQPLHEVAAVVHEHAPNTVLHTDAVQAFPWLDVASLAAPADLVSISAHKFGGPQGVGALVVRPRARLEARILGGGQERERRSGTHNVAGIVAMAAAAEATVADRADAVERVGKLRDRLVDGLLAACPGAIEAGVVEGDRAHKIAGNAHLCFPGIESEALLFLLEHHELMASAASSCASGAQDPSHVLAAMGVPRAVALGALRLSLGYSSTDADVDHALRVVPEAVATLEAMGS